METYNFILYITIIYIFFKRDSFFMVKILPENDGNIVNVVLFQNVPSVL